MNVVFKKKQGMLKQEPGIFLSYEVLLNYDKKKHLGNKSQALLMQHK